MYDDPNAAVPVAFCPVCGGEIYGPSGCLWCWERGCRMLTDREDDEWTNI